MYSNMSHKYFEDQFDDEDVLYVFRKHPIVMRKGLIVGMLCWLIGPVYTIAATYLNPTNMPSLTFLFVSLIVSMVIGVIVMSPWWISWYFSLCIMTNQRFLMISQKGLFSRKVSDIGLDHIQTMNYQIEGLEETLLGFGTITIQTYMGDIEIKHVHHPAKTQKKMVHIMRDLNIEPAKYQMGEAS